VSDWSSPATRYYLANIGPQFPATKTPIGELQVRWRPFLDPPFLNDAKKSQRAAVILENESFLLRAFQEKGLWIEFFKWATANERSWFLAEETANPDELVSPRHYYPSVIKHLSTEKPSTI
jgi:hypothetical protein